MTWIKSYQNKLQDEITHPYPWIVKVRVWISNYIPHKSEHVDIYQCHHQSLTMLVKDPEMFFRNAEMICQRFDFFSQAISLYWCAILIAHQLLWQNMEVPVSNFQQSPLVGEPRERLFHIHSVHRYQLCTKYLYPFTLLWQINCCDLKQQPGIIHWCYLFRCWKFNYV